jgi:osmoprotectant transport system ATP-binding protein
VIRLEHVTKRYPNGHVAVEDLSLSVADGEICVLVGPSGCGKTTTMRMINRLIEPTSGRILLDDEDVTRADPVELRRRIGYVIQQIGLFPHLTIAQNVGTVPQLLGWSRARTRARVDELLDLVGLDPATYRDRYPAQLSGGQRQRVGVARALGADPSVLLMDEPFGAIDPITRERLQDEFLRLQDEVRKTVVFVTHDVEEAVKLGDRIAILEVGGVLAQHDTPGGDPGQPGLGLRGRLRGGGPGAEAAQGHRHRPRRPRAAPRAGRGPGPRRGPAQDGCRPPRLRRGPRRPAQLRGYLARSRAEGDGTVGDRLQRLEAWVRAEDTLKDAFSEMLLYDAGWVAVLDDDDRFLGVLTPESLYEASRRSR